MAENETAARERCGSREQQQDKPTTIKMSGAKDETGERQTHDRQSGLGSRVQRPDSRYPRYDDMSIF